MLCLSNYDVPLLKSHPTDKIFEKLRIESVTTGLQGKNTTTFVVGSQRIGISIEHLTKCFYVEKIKTIDVFRFNKMIITRAELFCAQALSSLFSMLKGTISKTF